MTGKGVAITVGSYSAIQSDAVNGALFLQEPAASW